MSEAVDGSNPYAWLVERSIFQKDKKAEKVVREKKFKEEKKERKKLEVSTSDKHVMQRFIWNTPMNGDVEQYPLLVEKGLMAKADLPGQTVYGLTQAGSEAIE